MAQQSPTLPHQQQGLQRPYSPYPPAGSPTASPSASGGISLPPAKRPRLSPNPPSYASSPYATSPPSAHLSLPTTPSTAYPAPFNQPQPIQNADSTPRGAPGSMGPPQKPADRPDKATDINDLSDLVFTSGIDLRQEEELLTYRSQQNASFSTSFNSQSSSTISPNNSFGQWQPNATGHAAFQGAGTLSQPAVTQAAVDEEIKRKHDAARAIAETHKHLNDPFLQPSSVRTKLHQKAFENGIQINVEGLFDKLPEQPQGVSGRVMRGADGTGVVSLKAHSLLQQNATIVDMLSLLSLAANERLRGVLEDAYTLARGRRQSASGVVPPDFVSISIGNGEPKPATAVQASITGSAWDAPPQSAISPTTIPPKRDNNNSNRLPTPPTETPPTPQPTQQYTSPVPTALISIAKRDRSYEEARIAARKRRRQSTANASGDGTGTGASTPGTGPSTPAAAPAPAASTAPDLKPMTKKERDRIAKQGQTEEVLHRAANQTASLALGGRKKKYSWMTGGGAGGGIGSGASTPRINTAVGGSAPATPGVSTAGGGPGGGPGKVDESLRARERRYGDFREDGRGGEGIQLRDLFAVLDADGREKKTRSRWGVRMGAGDQR